MAEVSFPGDQQKVLGLVSIVVPAYNEDDVIVEFNRRLSLVRQDLSLPSEVIFVNDGSTDDTLRLLRALKAADPTIGIVDLSRNFGKEIALTAGLDYAHGDAVVVIDADLQHPPELIPKFIARWRQEDADVVYGQRASRAGETQTKRVTSRIFYRVINKLSGRLIPIDASDFCILSRRAVDALAGVRERHRFMKGLFVWIGYRQVPMLYEPDPRFAGVSKWNYWKLWNFSIEGITSFSIEPLKFATYRFRYSHVVNTICILYDGSDHDFWKPGPGFPVAARRDAFSRRPPTYVSRDCRRVSRPDVQRGKAEATLFGQAMGSVSPGAESRDGTPRQ